MLILLTNKNINFLVKDFFFLFYNQNKGVDGKGRILDLDLGPTVDSLRFQPYSLREFMIGTQKLAP